MQQLTNLSLGLLGCAGILLHCLRTIVQLKKTKTFKIWEYFDAEWPSILISFIVVMIALVCKSEITALDAVGQYLGLGFVAIGYMGQSLLVATIGKAESKIGITDDTQNTDKNAKP